MSKTRVKKTDWSLVAGKIIFVLLEIMFVLITIWNIAENIVDQEPWYNYYDSVVVGAIAAVWSHAMVTLLKVKESDK